MKIVTPATTFVLCLLLTGCSRFRLMQDSELSFYDPFAGDSNLAPTQSVADSGRVRITDYREPGAGEAGLARYPEVVDTDLTLLANGANNSKPQGISNPDPYYLTENESRTSPTDAVVSTEAMDFEVDPFAAEETPLSHVVASAPIPLPVGIEESQPTMPPAERFSEPVLPTSMVEAVSTPVDDEPVAVKPQPVARKDGFRTSSHIDDDSASIGWRATR